MKAARDFGLWTSNFGLYPVRVNKHERIAGRVKEFSGDGVDPRYAGYFALFNRQKFFEAHDVLEDLWLPDRHGANGNFFKGLIQLAGAFVHLQKNRLRPAAALFQLAQASLEKYPASHEHLNLAGVRQLIGHWLSQLAQNDFQVNPLSADQAPQLTLLK